MASRCDVARVLDPVALQRAEVVAIAELEEQVLQDRPVAVARGRAELALEPAAQVGLDAVVVEQRVVDVDQEHDPVRCAHDGCSFQRLTTGSERSCS